MAKKNSGTSIPPKSPASPPDPIEALSTNPGDLSQIQQRNSEVKKTTLGSAKVKPEPPTSDSGESEPVKLTWISVELQDNDGKAVPYMPFTIEFSDKSTSGGVTGKDGKCKLEGVVSGSAKIDFIGVDKREWKPK